MGINPRGLVPCLVHDGEVHIESNDIILYLERAFPAAPGAGLEEPRLEVAATYLAGHAASRAFQGASAVSLQAARAIRDGLRRGAIDRTGKRVATCRHTRFYHLAWYIVPN
jgi:glutathione S-transferase